MPVVGARLPLRQLTTPSRSSWRRRHGEQNRAGVERRDTSRDRFADLDVLRQDDAVHRRDDVRALEVFRRLIDRDAALLDEVVLLLRLLELLLRRKEVGLAVAILFSGEQAGFEPTVIALEALLAC